MKAFVSYSFRDSELYLVTLLLEQLRKSGYIVETGIFNGDNQYGIRNSNIFIGIITNNSNSTNYVIDEWKIAKQNNIQNILIIEDGIKVQDPNIKFLRFNRNNPTPAINALLSKTAKQQNNNQGSGLGEVLVAGSIIVGIAALISLLAKGNK